VYSGTRTYCQKYKAPQRLFYEPWRSGSLEFVLSWIKLFVYSNNTNTSIKVHDAMQRKIRRKQHFAHKVRTTAKARLADSIYNLVQPYERMLYVQQSPIYYLVDVASINSALTAATSVQNSNFAALWSNNTALCDIPCARSNHGNYHEFPKHHDYEQSSLHHYLTVYQLWSTTIRCHFCKLASARGVNYSVELTVEVMSSATTSHSRPPPKPHLHDMSSFCSFQSNP
jgi:hypothetical protein